MKKCNKGKELTTFAVLSLFLFFNFFYGQTIFIVLKYKIDTRGMVPITSIDKIKKRSTDSVVYLGRQSCPNCREFVAILKKEAKKSQKRIYYLNTEKQQKNSEFKKFIKDNKISSVPTLIKINNREIKKIYSYPKLEEKEIKILLK